MSEPTPEPTIPPTNPDPEPPAPGDTPPEKDWQAEAEKWKALSRKHEESSKANADKARRFDEIDEASKSELQKLADKVTSAEQRAAEAETAAARMAAAVKHGLTEGDLDLLGTGTAAEIEQRAARLAERLKAATPPAPSADGQGPTGTPIDGPKQLTKADLAGMSPAEIDKAREEGRLTQVLTGGQ